MVRATFFLVALLAGAVACAPSESAVDSGVRKIAFLRSVSIPDSPTDRAFMDQLAKHGFHEGRNLAVIGGRNDEAYPDRQAAEAAVRQWHSEGVDLILAYSTTAAEVARDHAPGIPILFLVNDPVAVGFVRDGRRPEGSLTGVTFQVPADRMLNLARRILPALQRVGLPYPPGDPAAIPSRDQFAQAARNLGLELITEPFSGEEDLTRAVNHLVEAGRVQLLVASVSPTATRALPKLAEAAAAYGIPYAANVENAEGALLTLAPDGRSMGQQLGRQAVRLLNGATPEAVPVENPQRFRLVVSERVADQLGIPLSADVMREADVVRR